MRCTLMQICLVLRIAIRDKHDHGGCAMSEGWSRRRFVSITSSLSALGLSALGSRVFAQSVPAAPNLAPEAFPSHDPALVKVIVSVSHSDIKRVRELVEKQPALARASTDWGV